MLQLYEKLLSYISIYDYVRIETMYVLYVLAYSLFLFVGAERICFSFSLCLGLNIVVVYDAAIERSFCAVNDLFLFIGKKTCNA